MDGIYVVPYLFKDSEENYCACLNIMLYCHSSAWEVTQANNLKEKKEVIMCDDSGGCDSGYDSGSSFDCSYATARETVIESATSYETFDEGEDMALDFGSSTPQQQQQHTAPFGASSQQGGSTMNLAKTVQAGERINLSKQVGAAVTKYAMGLNWNVKPGINADCDLSIVLLDEAGNIIPGSNGPNMPKCMCYYGQQELPGVKSYGDNQDGTDGAIQNPTNSDEQCDCDFSMLEPNVAQVLIIATTHSEVNGQPGSPLPFGRVAIPVLTIYNNTNGSSPVPLYTFELDEDASVATAVEVAKFYKKSGDWRYVSMIDEIGQDPYGLNGIVAKYNIG